MASIISRLSTASLLLWGWWWVGNGAEAQTLGDFLADQLRIEAGELSPEEWLEVEDLLHHPPVLTPEDLILLKQLGWLTAEDERQLTAASLPADVRSLAVTGLSPPLRNFFALWLDLAAARSTPGYFLHSQRFRETTRYRWKWYQPLSPQVSWTGAYSRSPQDPQSPPCFRWTVDGTRSDWTGLLGDVQVRTGLGLLAGGLFPRRLTFEARNQLLQAESRLTPYRSVSDVGRLRGGAVQFRRGRIRSGAILAREPAVTVLFGEQRSGDLRWGATLLNSRTPNRAEGAVYVSFIRTDQAVAGEWARDAAGRPGWLVAYRLSRRRLTWTTALRSYSPRFQPELGNPPRRLSTLTPGERGWYEGVLLRGSVVSLETYWDVSQEPSQPRHWRSSLGIRGRLHISRGSLRWLYTRSLQPDVPELQYTPQDLALNTSGRRLRIDLVPSFPRGRKLIIQWIGLESSTKGRAGALRLEGRVPLIDNPLTSALTLCRTGGAPLYIWNLNLPYEMGSTRFTVSALRWEVRYLGLPAFGGRCGLRWAYTRTARTGSWEGAFQVETPL